MSKLKSCLAKSVEIKGKEISLEDSFGKNNVKKLLEFRERYIEQGLDVEAAESNAIIEFYNEVLVEELRGLQLQVKQSTQKKFDRGLLKNKVDEIGRKYDALQKIEDETFQFDLKDSDLETLIEEGYDNATIVKAVKEANRLLKLPNQELFNALKKLGIFNLGLGEKMYDRPDLGLSAEEYNTTLKQLESGKETKTVEVLNKYLNDLKTSGDLKMIRGVGGMTERPRMPLYYAILDEKLTKPTEENKSPKGFYSVEEQENLEKDKARQEYEAAEAGDNYQKKKESATPAKDIQKVIERMQKAFPKYTIKTDNTIVDKEGNPVAGKIKGSVITINPDYADTDTPIHEAGHALIDFMGYSNKVIQKGIEQLKSTDLWKETKKRYPELSEEMLGKEVLAEAIGREGADIFDTEVQKTKFKQVLDYIFDWLKRKLGLEKNVAKSLAKQIISGVGTKNIEPTMVVKEGKKVSFQMPSGEKVDGKEVQVDVVNGFYSNLEKQLLQIKLDKIPAKQWADKLKGEEAKWTGLTDWLNSQQGSVSKKDIQQFLKDNRISIVEVTKGSYSKEADDLYKKLEAKNKGRDFDDWDSKDQDEWMSKRGEPQETKFSQYQLEGEKENYKEVLVTFPNEPKWNIQKDQYGIWVADGGIGGKEHIEGETREDVEKQIERYKEVKGRNSEGKFKSSHFDEPNILVHLRMNTRTDAEGNKVLFLEEVQSDWGQTYKKNNGGNHIDYTEGFRQEKQITSAPFVTDTNAWTKLGLKVGLKEAVKQGIDKIAWTTGEQQNDRYDLSKEVSKIDVEHVEEAEGVFFVDIALTNGDVENLEVENGIIRNAPHKGQRLDAVIGKEYADKILSTPKGETVVLEGSDLKLGGKGMKGFYGSPSEGNLGIVGSVAKKLFNQEPKMIELKTRGKGEYDVGKTTDDVKKFSKRGDFFTYNGDSITKQKAYEIVERGAQFESWPKGDVVQHSIDITPELIKQAGEGLPMFQKPKKYKELEELTQSELQRKITKSFEGFREDVLKRDLTDVRNMLIQAKEGLVSDESSEEDKIIYQQVIDALKLQERRDKAKWMAYKEDKALVKEFLGKKPISDMSVEELVEAYNMLTSGNVSAEALGVDFTKVKKELAYKLFTERKEELKKYKNFVEQQANVTDLKPRDVLMKTLSHMSESFPELQKFGTLFDNAYFDMQTDRNDLKVDLEKLGKDVIKEKNKQLGIKDKGGAFLFSNSAKYFDFVEHPDGRYYTLDEAKQKGFTEAQTKFLKFMLNLNKLRNEQLDATEVVDEVLKVDKSVGEAFQTEGLMQAFSAYLGNGFNIKNVVIDYDGKKMPYGEVEKDLMRQGEKGTIEKAVALAKMLKYNFKARRQLKTGVGADNQTINVKEAAEYQLSTDGKLRSKFNKSRDKGRSYSKDFYHAAFEFIDDYTHVKHMNPIMPYINSIEELNQSGFEEHAAKPEVVKWIKEWKDLHLFKQKKVGVLGPEVDVALKTLRKLSSATTMFFNLPANMWNVAMGTYNNIRAEAGKDVVIGSKRLAKDWARGGKAVDILNKYQVISIDKTSNPKLFAGRILDQIGYAFNRIGETYIQGSMFLGQMTEDEFNSFEYKTDEYGVKKLVLKDPSKEDEFRKKFIAYKNRVSDIQGKYAEKDMRNFTNSEFGKAIGQFKIWLPDALKERFGERYIDRNDVEHVGSYKAMFGQGLEDLRAEMKDKGRLKTLMTSNSTEAKAFRTNLKGAMVLAVLFSLKANADDDDEEAAIIDKALGQILFIFDPHQVKFTIANPIPAVGVLTNFVNVLDEAKQGKFEKSAKDASKLIPMNKVIYETEKLLEEE